MKRRQFILLLGSVTTGPLVANAQQSSDLRHIGILVHGVETDPLWQERLAVFRKGLAGLGWIENRNVSVEVRYTADNYDHLPRLAREMVALNPDVIFSNTTPAIKALQQETHSIPMVFVEVSDPVGSGVVASLARPSMVRNACF